MDRVNGGTMVVRTLRALGVEKLFGIVSVHNVPIYDAIAREGGIEPIMVRHEQGAGGMADGYARATGRPGVYVTSTGPGAANAAGAMLEAFTASSPVLHITGQVETPFLDGGRGFLHEAKDQLGMLRAVTKHAERVTAAEGIPEAIVRCFNLARSGRPGPVALEIPIDLQYAEADFVLPDVSSPAVPAPGEGEVAEAARALAAAGRPLIWAGGGVVSAGAADELRLLAERLGAPVVTTHTGRGAIPEDHPLALGQFFNDREVRELVASSDCLLAVGTRFEGAHTLNWTLKLPQNLIHVNVDPAAIGLNYPTSLAIVADARSTVVSLVEALGAGGAPADSDYAAEIARIRAGSRARAREDVAVHVPIMDALRGALARDAIVVKDATLPAYTWGNRLLDVYEPRTSMHPTTVAIGPGLALALGARLGRPERQTVLMVGDGGFMLNIAELATAVQHDIRIVILLFNDRGYGVLRNHQDQRFGGRRIAVDLHTPDFVKLADGFGLRAERVSTIDGFGPALGRALAAAGPVLLDIDELEIGVPLFPSPRQPSMAVTRKD